MSQIRVLVVDDDFPVLTSLCDFLEDEGFYVQSAASGEDALEILRQDQFDIGVVDIRLPGMDGNTLVMKAHEIYPGMKFVIYTGSSEYNLPGYLKELGISPENVFLKPLSDLEAIVNSIKQFISEGGP